MGSNLRAHTIDRVVFLPTKQFRNGLVPSRQFTLLASDIQKNRPSPSRGRPDPRIFGPVAGAMIVWLVDSAFSSAVFPGTKLFPKLFKSLRLSFTLRIIEKVRNRVRGKAGEGGTFSN